jgi:alpha-galactosidase
MSGTNRNKEFHALGLGFCMAIGVSGFISSASSAVSRAPPMGWNSYDSKNFSVTEAEVKAVADTMAKKYLPYGWQYVVVDWGWYFPGMGSQGSPNQNWNTANPAVPQTPINIDAYGRPMPDAVRHPSSANGAGFKPLADYVRSKGLKFGIHLMRGMYRQAYWANTPVLGTTYHARDVTDGQSRRAVRP